MDNGRRKLLAVLSLSPLLAATGSALAAGGDRKPRRFNLSANAEPDGRFGFAAFDAEGEVRFERRLPGRAHGFAVRPASNEAVVFARRPGSFAIAFGVDDGRTKSTLIAPGDRHFFGHGVFSSDGGTLFTTENDTAAGRGVIGVWDAGRGYRRVGEFPSHGIGPHELLLAKDGRTLIVANGGILTHPDFGRRKLNIPTMDPSLAYVDAHAGNLLEECRFPVDRERLLSIRHVAQSPDGTVCIALQDQGPHGDHVPLVAFHRRGETALQLAHGPRPLTRRLQGYMGAVAIDSSGRTAAVSAPRGNLITFWDVAARRHLGAISLTDGCGVAPDGTAGGFFATSGAGGAIRVDAVTRAIDRLPPRYLEKRQWDNHLVPVVRQA